MQGWRSQDPDDGSNDVVAATMSLSADGAELSLDGEFGDGTARKLRRILRSSPGIKLVILRSEGGLVDEAEQVGDIVAAHGLTTYVSDFCVSACTLAFVRARERLISPGAQLGFHAPWEAGRRGQEMQVSSDDERQAYVAAGVAPDFVDRALATPSSDIWFPEPERLLQAGVVSAVLTPAEAATRLARARSEFAGLLSPN